MLSCILAAMTALTELVPAPQQYEISGGEVGASALERIRVVNAAVSGAPARVASQAYKLQIAPEGVTITASSKDGERYARTTLEQLMKLADGKVEACTITDWPNLEWRGIMLDTARNFLTMNALKSVVDIMARYKMNLFHWHLTEDNGWRLESKLHPELQAEKSFYDQYGDRSAPRHYSQADFRELVAYAAQRGVRIMPEFDVPGHCLAFRRAYDITNMKEKLVEPTITELIGELCSLASVQDVPFVHLGGDEVWKPHEECVDGAFDRWAQRVCESGRQVVSWEPGHKTMAANRIEMIWGSRPKISGKHPCFDARVCYIEEYDPFALSSFATFTEPCREVPDEFKYGAIICGWHDNAAGKDCDVSLRNQCVMPSIVMFGNLMWRGGAGHHADYRGRLPELDNPLFSQVADLERRVVAQRDRVLTDTGVAFPFMSQTKMRWRISRPDGTLIAKDVPQATIFFHPMLRKHKPFVPETNGTVVVETWIKSPRTMDVGAWVGFTAYDKDHGRSRSAPMPKLGEWSRFGAKAELNGEEINPPKWDHAGMARGNDTLVWGMSDLTDRAYGNADFNTRPPTPIRLREGWNYVKLTVPYTEKHLVMTNWVATFMPMLGTTEHPREVPGLEYSSEPQM